MSGTRVGGMEKRNGRVLSIVRTTGCLLAEPMATLSVPVRPDRACEALTLAPSRHIWTRPARVQFVRMKYDRVCLAASTRAQPKRRIWRI